MGCRITNVLQKIVLDAFCINNYFCLVTQASIYILSLCTLILWGYKIHYEALARKHVLFSNRQYIFLYICAGAWFNNVKQRKHFSKLYIVFKTKYTTNFLNPHIVRRFNTLANSIAFHLSIYCVLSLL